MKVVLAAGGTAGHVEPALNLAAGLQRHTDVEILVLGGTRGLEGTLVPARGYRLETVASVPMPRRPSVELIQVPGRVWETVRQAEAILTGFGAEVVVGFGGYAAVPGYLAARRKRLPLVIHEANAKPGLANRLAARFTPYVFTAVAGTIAGAQVVGMPMRETITGLDRATTRDQALAHFGLRPDAPVLLVFGGSQGAASLNAAVAGALPQLLSAEVQVLHAYGMRNEAPLSQPGYVPLPYVDRMDLAYAAADLAVVRAGAMTCAELAAVGLPAVYVPLPIGNGEQRLNALPVVNAGGGLLVEDAAFTSEWLLDHGLAVLHDGVRLAAMAAAARAHGVRDADDVLARRVIEIVRKEQA